MQQERLIIKDFFTLKNIDIELAKFNIFIGEQASGKGLLVKLVYFFRNISRTPISSYQFSQDQHIKYVKAYVAGYFKTLFRLDVNSHKYNFKIEYSFNEFKVFIDGIDQQVNVNFSDNLMSLYEDWRSTLSNINKQFSDKSMEAIKLQQSIMQSHIIDLLTKSELGTVRESLFIPASRDSLFMLPSSEFNTIYSGNTDAMSVDSSNDYSKNKPLRIDSLLRLFGFLYQSVKDSYRATLDHNFNEQQKHHLGWLDTKAAKILKGSYLYDDAEGYIEQECGLVRPWHASSGQQEFLPVYLFLRYYLLKEQKGCLYIEEPEAHLYPTAQKDILELLVYTINATNSDSLCITTHSPYILTVLNNLIMANEVKDKQTVSEPNLLVPFDDVRAYFINNEATLLMNKEYNLIDAEKLDEVSNIISSEYSSMVDL